MTQRVFFFGGGEAEGSEDMVEVLGIKGAAIAAMAKSESSGNMPTGFTISASSCLEYLINNKYSDLVRVQVEANMARLEAVTGKRFGGKGGKEPLLISVEPSPVVAPVRGLIDVSLIGLAEVPSDPNEQLWDALEAVWKSWGAVSRRSEEASPSNVDRSGTAINILMHSTYSSNPDYTQRATLPLPETGQPMQEKAAAS